MEDEIKKLLPAEIFKLSNGEQVEIRPVPFGKLRIFSEAVASLIRRFTESGIQLESIGDWKSVFDLAFEETLNILSLVIDKPRAWFDSITITDGLGILNIVIGQNFNEDSKKNLSGLLAKVRTLLQMQSSSLSSTATGGKKSKDTTH